MVISKALEVKALLIEMSMLPIHAPSIRHVQDEISAAACDGNIHRLADLGCLGLRRGDGRDERLLVKTIIFSSK